MIKFLFKKYKTTLSLDVDNAETPSAHIFDGGKDSIELIKEALYASHNMFGHSVSENAPAIDVNHALLYSNQIDLFDAEVIEGQKIIDDWTYPEMPEGSVT